MAADLKPIAPRLRDLAEARTLPEVKEIRDRAAALEGYAREAGNPELMDHAVEVRLNAERKGGSILREMAERGERARGSAETRQEFPLVTLDDLGLTKKQSHFWQKLAGLDEDAFTKRLADARYAAWMAVGLNAKERQEEKLKRRGERESELGAKQRALPDRVYGVVYADPEWRFEPYSRQTGMDRSVDNHYPTSALDVIKARNVPSIAADDCVLFLWSTAPMQPQAYEVMEAWGFDYKSQVIWDKGEMGTGYWFRNCHEVLLVGTRGKIPAPAPGTQWLSVVHAPVGAASEKPEIFYQLIEAYFPNLPKIELNARRQRLGWDAWGLEAPDDEAAA